MDLVKTKIKIRCEMGACKNLAEYTIMPSRVGVKSRIHICKQCLLNLKKLVDTKFVVTESVDNLVLEQAEKNNINKIDLKIADIEKNQKNLQTVNVIEKINNVSLQQKDKEKLKITTSTITYNPKKRDDKKPIYNNKNRR